VDEEIPMTEHDIPLTAIITPQEVLRLNPGYARPKSVYWSLLPEEKVAAIPVLNERIKGNG
jgi:5-formyltetrahydrofolate cyclo-ligase